MVNIWVEGTLLKKKKKLKKQIKLNNNKKPSISSSRTEVKLEQFSWKAPTIISPAA